VSVRATAMNQVITHHGSGRDPRNFRKRESLVGWK
jgi:ribosomal protein L2